MDLLILQRPAEPGSLKQSVRVGIFAMLGLCLVILTGCEVVEKNCWIPPSVLNEVTIRKFPPFDAIEAEVKGTIAADWGSGFRLDARYLRQSDNPLQYPVLINLPIWENNPPSPKGLFYVQLILRDEPDHISPKAKGLGLISSGTQMVACYAWKGAYTYENFTLATQKIRRLLQHRGIPTSGPPRILLYTNPDWAPKDGCVGEVQIPVPDKISAD